MTLHIAIALIPLAIYLLMLGFINLSPRPFMTTGVRDLLALGFGMAGLIIAGPMELFMPERAAQEFGALVWVLMITLYLLTCLLIALASRPRLVIYNIQAAELKPLLERTIKSIDSDASWAEEIYVLPNASIQLHLETQQALRNVSLVSIGPRQSWQAWRQLEAALGKGLSETRSQINPYGVALLIFSLVIGGVCTFYLAQDRQAVAQSLWEMLRF